ncbi:Fc receptor-like protein 5 isoform X2 [Channa argus]|uniref:Fc receptor-like protein 5 isoform X2 n=1 Tax=Channa argus TaxID=215402 RepID=UPI003521C367
MQLTPFCLMLSCLRISPDRSQFSRYDTISLNCEDQLNSTGWKVKRKTVEGGIRPCSSGWGTASSGSTCIIGNIYPSDSGVYWCESVDGQQTNSVNITITDRAVILESPALPVSEGAAVTLHCKAEMNPPSHVFHFYKDGRHIGNSSTGEMTIHSASKSDEGLYKCSTAESVESASSWLAVDVSLSNSNFTSSASPVSSAAVFRLTCHLLVGIPYLLSTILLGLIYRDRKKAAQRVRERRRSSKVIMEIAV